MPEIFEQAARLKLRFETPRGDLSAEDLWDLPLTSTRGVSLDDVAVGLHRRLQDSTPVSFVNENATFDPKTQLRFDLVMHVIDVRKAENAARATEAEKVAKRQRIMALISEKEDEALSARSTDELRELLASL